MKNVDLTQVHYLSGPFEIETAEPGDVLLVEIQDVQPFEHQPWGFTGIFDKNNGGGFLDELYPEAYVSNGSMFTKTHNVLVLKRYGTLKASSALPAIFLVFASQD